MLCLQDCIDMSDLPQEAIDAIAGHEHVPEIVAVELGCTLVQSRQGIGLIREYLQDEMQQASKGGNADKLGHLRQAAQDFERDHPL